MRVVQAVKMVQVVRVVQVVKVVEAVRVVEVVRVVEGVRVRVNGLLVKMMGTALSLSDPQPVYSL